MTEFIVKDHHGKYLTEQYKKTTRILKAKIFTTKERAREFVNKVNKDEHGNKKGIITRLLNYKITTKERD